MVELAGRFKQLDNENYDYNKNNFSENSRKIDRFDKNDNIKESSSSKEDYNKNILNS